MKLVFFLSLVLLGGCDMGNRRSNLECENNQRRIIKSGELKLQGCEYNNLYLKSECPPNERVEYNKHDVSLVGCTFREITTIAQYGVTGGGAINVLLVGIKLSQCEFINCRIMLPQFGGSFANGGAIQTGSSQNVFTDCLFDNCSAGYSSGAFYSSDCTGSIISNCLIKDCMNDGDYLGSAISIEYKTGGSFSAIVEFIKTRFENCRHTSPNIKNLLQPSTLNLASHFTDVKINATLINCKFADTDDFAIFSQPSYLTVVSTVFENIMTKFNNYAACIHCTSEHISDGRYFFSNISFNKCKTDDYGVVNVPNVEFNMISCHMIDCVAKDTDDFSKGHGFMITDNDALLPIIIENCSFINNEVSNEGAGLYIDRAQQNVTIVNCLFKDNKVNNSNKDITGYGISLHSKGVGSIHLMNCEFDIVKQNDATSVSILGITNIVFENCQFNATGSSTNPKTAFYIFTDQHILFKGNNCYVDKGNGNNFHFKEGQDLTNLDICSSTRIKSNERLRIIKNSEINSGAALYSIDSKIVLVKCSFIECEVLMSLNKGCDGGAIFTKNCNNNYTDCIFRLCKAYGHGGAICDMDPKSISVDGCSFEKCSSKHASAYSLSGSNSISMNNLIFSECSQLNDNIEDALSCSVSLSNVNSVVFDNCQFMNIKQLGVYCEAASLTLMNSKFTSIKSDASGIQSCFFAKLKDETNGEFILKNVSFDDCEAASAGVMNIPDVSLSMEYVNITNCKSVGDNSHGFIITDSNTEKTVSIKSCLFNKCHSKSEGAGLYIDRTSSSITIEDCIFIKNTVEGAHGASIHSKGSSILTLSNCKFEFTKDNDATSVVFNNHKSITMKGCCFFSDGKKGSQPFHILSDTLIDFDPFNCFNDNLESNFGFAQGQDTAMINFNCEECRPMTPTKVPQSVEQDDNEQGSGGRKLNTVEVVGIIVAFLGILAIAIVFILFVIFKRKNPVELENSGVYDNDQSLQSCESIASSAFSTQDNEHVFDDEDEMI